MRPDPVGDRPFFRREAEEYRRQRHLGEIALIRPLSLRLVTLYPVAVVALLIFAASQVDMQLEFAALVDRSAGDQLSLSMDPGAARYIRPGEVIDYRIAGSERVHGEVGEVATGPCTEAELLFLRARSGTSGRTCFRITLTTGPTASAPPDPPVTARLWSPPIDYLSHILDD